MLEAVEGHFTLKIVHFGPMENRIVGNMTVEQWLASYFTKVRELRIVSVLFHERN
jgi:hypothetical protein